MLSRIKRLFDAGPRDPTAGGFDWSPRFALGYPFVILATCGYAAVALVAGLFPSFPRWILFPPHAVSVMLFGLGLSLALIDPRDICKFHLQEFWE